MCVLGKNNVTIYPVYHLFAATGSNFKLRKVMNMPCIIYVVNRYVHFSFKVKNSVTSWQYKKYVSHKWV